MEEHIDHTSTSIVSYWVVLCSYTFPDHNVYVAVQCAGGVYRGGVFVHE